MSGGGTDVRRRSRPLLTGIAALSFISAVGTVSAPVLVDDHPLLLVALCPRLLHLTVAASATSFPIFFAVATLRLVLADPLHFRLGRQVGARLLTSVNRRRGLGTILAVRDLVARAGPVAIALRPVGSVMAAAGASGMRAGPAAVANLVGTVVHVTAIYGCGRLVGQAGLAAVSPELLFAAGLIATGGAVALAACAYKRSLGPLGRAQAPQPARDGG